MVLRKHPGVGEMEGASRGEARWVGVVVAECEGDLGGENSQDGDEEQRVEG